ncbi:hypothetical protein [Lawsonia intracellularis]|uniref:hypothetical protein n=1 Tax=Lawsonia intracellularis TaxID=29546 RepID=UPI0011EF17BE|nr:hypothetical protein [Lawsonia intracellularis]KAA0204961.1 hypothetical protein C4K43_00410 [Lawsonia intracellularis]
MVKLNNVINFNKKLAKVNVTSLSMLLFNFIAIFFLIQSDAYAVIFSNSQPRIFTDVNTPAETYFGGFDMRDPRSPINSGPTSMTFTTHNLAQNQILAASGGSMGTAARGSVVNGDATITMHNTVCNFLYGGGYSEGPDVVVTGTANISVYNSQLIDIFGGGFDNGGHNGHTSVGAVKILVDHSVVQNLTGSASSVGIESQGRYAVFGDVDIAVVNGSDVTTLTGTSTSSAHIKGNLSILVENSHITDLNCVDHALLDGNLFVRIGPGALVDRLFLSTENLPKGSSLFEIDGGRVDGLFVGPYAGTLNDAKVLMKNGYVLNLDPSPRTPAGVIKNLDIFMEGGTIAWLNLAPQQGVSHNVTLHLDGGTVENLRFGNFPGANFDGIISFAKAEVKGGTIENIEPLRRGVLNSSLIFIPGGLSRVHTVENGRGLGLSNVTVQEGARTVWGLPGNRFTIEADDFDLGGTIILPSTDSTIELVVNNHLIASGGMFEFNDADRSRVTPLVVFTGNPGSSVNIIDPLSVNLDLPLSFLGTSGIVLAQATPNLADPKLFEPIIHKGLMWGDIVFDATSNTWFINNIRESKDYYGYLSVQGASNWLRQQHMITTQRRSANALLHKHDGLWVDIQAGHEKIGTNYGNSKMPWVMASAGYDYRKNINDNIAMLYGFALGIGDGHQKWTLVSKMKNRITMGLLDGYLGFSYNPIGLYGLVALQGSVSKIKTKSPGFFVNENWTEVVPTESLELGWHYAFNEFFTITPRAQMILEQTPKHSIEFCCRKNKEKIKLHRNTTVTTVAGILANYNIEWLDIHGSVDWIKGVAGTYKAHSELFNKTFKDKNNNSVLRASLGCDYIIRENMSIGITAFGDMINNKGIGGQANFSYKF